MTNNDSVFNKIAQALLVDYTSVYYVNAVTNEYQWYSNDPNFQSLQIEQGGEDFFKNLIRDAKQVIYKDDIHIFIEDMKKENLLAHMKNGTMQNIEYRLMIDGKPVYHRLRLIRSVSENDDYFILGVINVDAEVRRRMKSEKHEAERDIYNQIAASLAEHYDTLYYVDMENNNYFEFSSTDVYKKLHIKPAGADFFSESRKNLNRLIHPDDRERVVRLFSKETIIKNLSEKNTFTLSYRLYVEDEVMHVRCSQIWAKDSKHIIICLENINNEVAIQNDLQETKKKSITYAQIAESLALNYDVIYYVDCSSGAYAEYTANSIYGKLEIQEKGDDFFADAKVNCDMVVHPEDKARVANTLQRDYLITALEAKKQHSIDYRLIIDGKTQYTRFTVMWASDKVHFIIGVENINDEVREENKRIQALNMANELARRDELTGTRNKNAYRELEASVQKNIDDGSSLYFAIVVCDINGLKHINDTLGHKAGDKYIQSACKMICKVFAHSPIFRVGGDEFVAFLNSSDYHERDELISILRDKVMDNLTSKKGPVISVGMAVYEPESDRRVSEIFDRADNMMYKEKKYLKALGAITRL